MSGATTRLSGVIQRATVGTRRRTRQVAGQLRRRWDEGRAAELSDTDAPRLLFRPGNGRWYVADGERWFEPAGPDDLDALLGLLPVEVLDEQILASAGSAGGYVRVVEESAGPTLEFITSFGEVVRRATQQISGRSGAVADWQYGAHPDGWVETVATMRLDGVRRCTLTAFLPADDSGAASAGKQLAVQVTKGRRTLVEVHHLRRGEPTRVELHRSRRAAYGLHVTLQTSAPEQVDDERPLGFVAAGIEALA